MGTQIDDYTQQYITGTAALPGFGDPGKDISIYINSPGGSVYAGLGIYDTMQFISSDVATICTGMAASMAAVLLVARSREKTFGSYSLQVMIHQPMGGAQGQRLTLKLQHGEIMKMKKNFIPSYQNMHILTLIKYWADSDRDWYDWMTAVEG